MQGAVGWQRCFYASRRDAMLDPATFVVRNGPSQKPVSAVPAGLEEVAVDGAGGRRPDLAREGDLQAREHLHAGSLAIAALAFSCGVGGGVRAEQGNGRRVVPRDRLCHLPANPCAPHTSC